MNFLNKIFIFITPTDLEGKTRAHINMQVFVINFLAYIPLCYYLDTEQLDLIPSSKVTLQMRVTIFPFNSDFEIETVVVIIIKIKKQ